jgi:hypothetical protein
MPVETRYFANKVATVNGFTGRALSTTPAGVPRYDILTFYNTNAFQTSYWGIRVWKRAADGSETEITPGTPVAVVSRTAPGFGVQTATWNCPEVALSPTDAIRVTVYGNVEGGSWTPFYIGYITERLNASKLNAALWTVKYYTKCEYVAPNMYLYFYIDDDGESIFYDSRIEGFTWTPVPAAKFVETIYVSSIPKRSAKYKRKRVGDLSVITDFFSYVYTPVVKVFKQYFVENLSILSAYIRTARSYSRAKVAQVPVSTYYVRKTAYSRRIVDIAYISGIFKRLVNYKRRIVNTAYVSDVFRRKLSFQRFHVENLSVTRDLFKRRVGYFRAWKENIPTSDIFKRRIAYYRTKIVHVPLSVFFKAVRSYRRVLPQTVAVKDMFKRLATYHRRIIEDLSALTAIFKRSISYTRRILNLAFISDLFRKSVSFPRRFIEDLSALTAILKRRGSYLRKLVNLAYISDVFSHVYTPIIKIFKRYFVEDLSALSVTFKRRIAYFRRMVALAYVADVFRRMLRLERLIPEPIIITVQFKRTIHYFRRVKEEIIAQTVKVLKKIKKWLVWLSRRLKLTVEKPQHAEFHL